MPAASIDAPIQCLHCHWRSRAAMIVARIVGVIVLIALAVAVIMWLFTRDNRYLWFAYRVMQLTVLAGVVFFGILILEKVL